MPHPEHEDDPEDIPQQVARIERVCWLEATARKVGNVHPGASFSDLTYADFLAAAQACARPLAEWSVRGEGLGACVLAAVRATRAVATSNVNLGIVLGLAPLVGVPRHMPLRSGIAQVLKATTVEDTRLVYEAIRLAIPGGMGQVEQGDVAGVPHEPLATVMGWARERDRIAELYVTDFELVLCQAVPILQRWIEQTAQHGSVAAPGEACVDSHWPPWEQAICGFALELQSRWPDTLIARKCGLATAQEAAARAARVIEAGWPATNIGWNEWEQFDVWLRSDGHRRNPGTTADLVALSLYAFLRDYPTNDSFFPLVVQ